ncbi:hypothetical protein D3C86_1392760 [compost metagenome]
MVGAVGGNDHRGNVLVEMLAQMSHHITADHPVIEVIVRENQFRRLPAQRRQRSLFIGGDQNVAAPLPEQRAHAVENAHFVVDHQ